MASYKAFIISAFLLVTITIIVQSAPIEDVNHSKLKDLVKSGKPALQSSLTKNKVAVNSEKIPSSPASAKTGSIIPVSQNSLLIPKIKEATNDHKKKRYIDDDQLDELLDSESDEVDTKFDNTLHTKVQETSATIHDNADKPVNTDDSKVFSDIKMTPNELTDIVRRRRNVKLNEESNRRRKRALSSHDFYDTNPFYSPYADLMDRHQYARPIRSFAPIYWYPSVSERNIRSALAPSSYESAEWPSLYPTTLDDDDETNENPMLIYNDNDDDENDYESNRYPILLQASDIPLDNLQLQQEYNTDDLPIDEDVDDNIDDDDNDDEEEQYRSYYTKDRGYYPRYKPLYF